VCFSFSSLKASFTSCHKPQEPEKRIVGRRAQEVPQNLSRFLTICLCLRVFVVKPRCAAFTAKTQESFSSFLRFSLPTGGTPAPQTGLVRHRHASSDQQTRRP